MGQLMDEHYVTLFRRKRITKTLGESDGRTEHAECNRRPQFRDFPDADVATNPQLRGQFVNARDQNKVVHPAFMPITGICLSA